jgi:sugar/nucleoside kinase (ribokinase family)
MFSATVTEPLNLGRWQEPAALIQAGLAPPDPYPIERIPYRAGCDQQFFGTDTPAHLALLAARLFAQVSLGTAVDHSPASDPGSPS